MRIEVLGCSGAAFPGHYPPGFLVDGNVPFGCRHSRQCSGARKKQLKVRRIFITHAHMDHIREIPFLADNLIIGGRKHRVNIFSILPVIRDIKNNLLNSKLWPDMTVLPNAHDAVIQLIALKAGKTLHDQGLYHHSL